MDVAELAARTDVPVRRLRYAIDHRVLPGMRHASPGHGVPRTFTEFEGFALALAALLLASGLTRKLVIALLSVTTRPVGPARARTDVPLHQVFLRALGTLEVGDGRQVRVTAARRPGFGPALDTGWLSLAASRDAPGDALPRVRVVVELGELARSVRPPGRAGGRRV